MLSRLTPTAEKVLPFYRSLPGVSFGTALQLASQFNSVKSCVGAAQVITRNISNKYPFANYLAVRVPKVPSPKY